MRCRLRYRKRQRLCDVQAPPSNGARLVVEARAVARVTVRFHRVHECQVGLDEAEPFARRAGALCVAAEQAGGFAAGLGEQGPDGVQRSDVAGDRRTPRTAQRALVDQDGVRVAAR
ncbi:hypothetical protein G6F35_017229 [Rhizopus arrhizus]|nr:hypothetical protein G6F35_017229 [Rhizopus arrhizus]